MQRQSVLFIVPFSIYFPEHHIFLLLRVLPCLKKMQRTVLVTGCSDGGIGSTLARVFQDRGLHVFATARNPDKMSQLKDLPNVTLLKLDVTSSADIQATVEVVDQKTGGTLDYLINNAAQGRFVPVIDEDLAQVKELFGVNVFAPLALTKAFVPLLIKAKGMVVYITSIGGYVHTPYLGERLVPQLY